jgi:trehalose utilization protein
MSKLRVTIWNEFEHELISKTVAAVYPDGIHEHLRRVLDAPDLEIRTAFLAQDEHHGLSPDVLNNTDVLLWWGHMAHWKVREDIANAVVARVHEGMGFIPMHSAHASKPFGKLMGTPCDLQWREANERAYVWTVAPTHPIAKGLPLMFPLEREEMYGEYFRIPAPDELIFITWYQGGNVFRGGCTFKRGLGKIFYFHPGHESYPSFYNANVIKVLSNAIRWAAPPEDTELKNYQFGALVPPIEEL